eukprot:12915211-Ditylum_brightwellii.AAC.1
MALTSTQSNPNVKRAVIAFQRPQARKLERGQYRIVDQVPARATGSAQGTKRHAGTPKLHSCQDPSQRQRVNCF